MLTALLLVLELVLAGLVVAGMLSELAPP